MNIVCRGDSHLKKWLKIDDGVIFLRYICRKGCIINQKGLKFGRKKQYLLGILYKCAVTSFAEVWIEIWMRWINTQAHPVTSFAEVWIEIPHTCYLAGGQSSLPSRKCGLKSFHLRGTGLRLRHFLRGSVDWNWYIFPRCRCIWVTSFAEVWIEITQSSPSPSILLVTSFAEVWIEIFYEPDRRRDLDVTSFAEVWIEIGWYIHQATADTRHFLRGSVDWNNRFKLFGVQVCCHFLRGSVDWNWKRGNTIGRIYVTSFAEVWIEIVGVWLMVSVFGVTSFAEVWIEIILRTWRENMNESLPSRKCGLKYNTSINARNSLESLPSRKCGLKWSTGIHDCIQNHVTSFAEVWIEIRFYPWTQYRSSCHFLRGSVDWNRMYHRSQSLQ